MDFLLNPDNGMMFPWSEAREAEHKDFVKILENEIPLVRKRVPVCEIIAMRSKAQKRHSEASDENAINVSFDIGGKPVEAVLPPNKDASVFDKKVKKEECPEGMNKVAFGMGADTNVIFEYKENVSNKIRQDNAEAGQPDLFGETKRTFTNLDPRTVTMKDLEGVQDDELIQFAKHALAKDYNQCPDDATDGERQEYAVWLRKQITQGVARLERRRNKFR